MKVIGICGTHGSGKGTVVEILKWKTPVEHVSARKIIMELAEAVGIKMENRTDLKTFNDNRHKNGGNIAKDFIQKYDRPENDKKVFILESIRRLNEIQTLREYFGNRFLLVAVDAPVSERYKRITSRSTLTDNVTLEEFKEQEHAESIGTEIHEMNIPACMQMADILLINDKDVSEFEKEIEEKIINSPFFQK